MVLRLGISYPSGCREEFEHLLQTHTREHLVFNELIINALEILHTRIQQLWLVLMKLKYILNVKIQLNT